MQWDKHSQENQSIFAGRWIAHLRGKIVGHGGTPKQALLAANANRYKEVSSVSFVPMKTPLAIQPVFQHFCDAFPPDIPIFLVGGAVRDLLLSRPVHDYDFVLPQNALEISREIANRLGAAYFPLDVDRGTARLIYADPAGDRNILDFSVYRGSDLDSDLRDRDFTINALALDVHSPQELLDPLGGASDLYRKQLRVCSPTSLDDDPIRVLRAIRLAANLGLHITTDTKRLMHDAVPGLYRISPERQRDELLRILSGNKPHTSIRTLEIFEILPIVFPELSALSGEIQSPPHTKDVWNHTLDVLRVLEGIINFLSKPYDQTATGSLILGLTSMHLGRYRENFKSHLLSGLVPDRNLKSLLFLAALYHDIAKPLTRDVEPDGRIRFFNHDQLGAEIMIQRAQALRLSNSETNRLATIVRHHMRPSLLSHEEGGPSQKAIYRFFRDTGEAGIDICLLSLADVWATYGPNLPQERWQKQLETVRMLLDAWWSQPTRQIYPPQLISGHDLISDLNLKPGPMIGEILEAVREAQVIKNVNSREEALNFAKNYIDNRNFYRQ